MLHLLIIHYSYPNVVTPWNIIIQIYLYAIQYSDKKYIPLEHLKSNYNDKNNKEYLAIYLFT